MVPVTAFGPARLRYLISASPAVLRDGLSEAEFDEVEHRFGFQFCSDHRELLALALPLGDNWPDWRDGSDADLRSRLDWPVDSVLFDVEKDAFWPRSWGQRPGDVGSAVEVAREHMRSVPKLVPVYGHRYLPAAPCQPRSPVFSVYQTDTIYYGSDLEDYLLNEFGGRERAVERRPSHIPFWSELAEGREDEL
jgi:hypothetical protein